MYNNPLGKKPSPRSSHRKIITFISKLCRSPAARPLQPRAPSPGAARPGVCQCAGVRAGARVRVCARVCVAPRRRGNAGEGRREGSCGCINLFNQKTQTHTHTKGGIKRGPRGGEEPRSCPARGEREEWTVEGRGPGPALGNVKKMDPRACV